MRAAILHGREDLRVEDVQSEPLQPGEVRVQVGAALTCGTDLKVFKRGYHARMIVPPARFGHEFAGTIVEVGSSAGQWKTGDRVVAANSAPCGNCHWCRAGQENLCDDLLFLNGSYAESIVVPARIVQKNLLPLQPGTSFADAALTEPLACVTHGMNDLKCCAGERILVLGAGPIGLMFVALGVRQKCDVTVLGRGSARLQAAGALGAKKVIDVGSAGTFPVPRDPSETFDVVVEAIGLKESWEAAIKLVRKGGRVNFFGGCPAGTTVNLDAGMIHYSSLTLLASFHHTPRSIREALAIIEEGVISAKTFVGNACSLDELPGLFREMAVGNRAVKTAVHTSSQG